MYLLIYVVRINKTGKFLWFIIWFYCYYYYFVTNMNKISVYVSVLKFSREVVYTH